MNCSFRAWWFAGQRVLRRALIVVLIVSLMLPGFSGFGLRIAVAQEDDPATPFSLAYVPRDALAIVAMRPSVLLQRPAVSPFSEAIRDAVVDSFDSPVQPADVVEMIIFALPDSRTTAMPAMTLRTVSRDAADALIATLDYDPQSIPFAGHSYQQSRRSGCVCRLSDTSVLVAPDEITIRRCLSAGESGASDTKWAEHWETVATADGAAMANTSLTCGLSHQFLAEVLREVMRNQHSREHASLIAYNFSPLWRMSDVAVAELSAADDVELRIKSQSGTEDEADKVYSAMRAALGFGRLALSRAREGAVVNDVAGPELMRQIDLFDQLLENAVVVQKESQVGVWLRIDSETTKTIAEMAGPVTLAARSARVRTSSINNLKHIGLAFHNYHDTYKTFPVASQIGPKDIPHSWRVTILPFTEHRALYDEYRQDEPWDSEHNLKLLEKMPDIYRCPFDQRKSTNTSYFVFDGLDAALDNRQGRSPRFANIVDGTSNTILAVESKRAVSWTKPEDIPFDPEQPLPEIGGWHPNGFGALFCDGAARMLPPGFDEQMMKYLIMRSDAHPVQIPGR